MRSIIAIKLISNGKGKSIKLASKERILIELGKQLGMFSNRVDSENKIDLAEVLKKARLRVMKGKQGYKDI